jgi:hypothetical protein
MATPIFAAKHLQDEEAAFAYVEAAIWPNGPHCPHCGGVERISKMQGKSTRVGLYKCYQSLASGDAPALLVQKRNFEQSASPHFGNNSQKCLVPVA